MRMKKHKLFKSQKSGKKLKEQTLELTTEYNFSTKSYDQQPRKRVE